MVTHDEWHKLANEKFKELKILDGPGYTVERKAAEGQRLIMRIPRQAEAKSGKSPFTLFEVVKAEGLDTYVQINGYNPEKDRYYNNWCVFGLRRVEVPDGVQVSVDSTGVIYLEATYDEEWIVTPKFSEVLPQEDATKRIRYLADVTMTDGNITAINQPPTGVIYLPPWLDNYDETKKMALIVNEGNWEFVEIGDCNA